MSSKQQHQKQTAKRLLSYFAAHKALLAIALVAIIVFSIVDAGMIYLIKPLIDDGLAHADGNVLQMGALIVIGIFVLRGIAAFVSNYSLAYVSTSITFAIRQQAFRHLQFLPMSYVHKRSNGELITKFTYDSEQLAKALAETLVVCVRESLIIVVLISIMFYTSWQLSLIFFVIGPAIAVVIRLVSRRFKQVSVNLQNAMGQVTRQCEQSIANHREVLALSTQAQEQERFTQINNYNRQQTMKLASASAMSNPVVQLIASLAIAAVFLLASIDGIIEHLTAGAFTATLVAMGSLLRPLKQLTNINQNLQRGLAAAESLFAFLDEPLEQDSGTQKANFKHKLQVQQLNFRYPNSEQRTLENINFELKQGEKLAIVGESGSGKSSLINALLRFYPTEQNGEANILIDDLAIEEISLSSLRQQFSLVSQSVVLFDDSIAKNISYGCKSEVTREQIEEAAKAAHVWEFARELPQGLDSPVGENGNRLSGGQRQRIAIARAILRDAPILILDEATSALDSNSEAIIHKALSNLLKNKACIVIAHRLSTISDADRILVMNKGEVCEAGTHEELIRQRGQYYQLYQKQNLKQESDE